MRKKNLRAPLLLTLIAGLQEGCGMIPGPATEAKDAHSLDRQLISAEFSDGHQYDLSVVRSVQQEGLDQVGRVIYVHGTPGDAMNWTDYLVDPVLGMEALAIDRPGFGGSEPTKSVERLAEQARAIEPLLEEVNGRKPILVGHSLGGPVVVRAAIDYPDRVGAIVIAAGSLDPELEKVLWIQHVGEMGLVRWLLPRWAKHSNQELIALEAELRELEPRLQDVHVPIVIVHGTADRLVPYANVPYMLEKWANHPRLDLITIEGGNHFLIWNEAGTVREAIERAAAMMLE